MNKLIIFLLRYVRLACYIGVAFFVSYFVHKRVQQEYYSRCSSDVIQIIFFRNSHFCVLLRNISDLIEGGYFDLFAKAVPLMGM
jgi:hypothetical protein